METELKICPFCGARPNPPSFSLDQSGKYGAAECPECLALGPEVRAPYGTTDWMGIAAGEWNRRAVPAPDQSDRERAIQFAKGTFGEDAKIEDSPFVDRLAAEFAKVREEQKEMDAKIADGMIDRNDAGKIDHDDIGSITALDIRDAIRRGEP